MALATKSGLRWRRNPLELCCSTGERCSRDCLFFWHCGERRFPPASHSHHCNAHDACFGRRQRRLLLPEAESFAVLPDHLLKHISHSSHSSPDDPGPEKVPASPRRCSMRIKPGTEVLGTGLPSGLLQEGASARERAGWRLNFAHEMLNNAATA